MRQVLTNADDVSRLCAVLTARKFPMTITIRDGRDRSREQNSLQWIWAQEVAEQFDAEPSEVQAEWKLMHGVPILRAQDDDFREKYDATFKPLPYETKLRIIQLMDWPVTRKMNSKQMTKYLDAVSKHCAENGLYLTRPDPGLADYMARNRAA
jgi:hypothetical protein